MLKGSGKVTRELVEQHTPAGEESHLFELVDVYFAGERPETVRLTGELLRRGSVDGNGVRITDANALLLQFVGAALRRARQLREVHRVWADGGDEAEVMRTAGIARPFLPRLLAQARATGPAVLRRTFVELRRADRDLKRGRGARAEELLERVAVCR